MMKKKKRKLQRNSNEWLAMKEGTYNVLRVDHQSIDKMKKIIIILSPM